MSLLDHAKLEMRLAGLYDKDSMYNGMLAESVEKLIKVFSAEGHSGYSAMASLRLFETLASYKILSPLKGTPDEWVNVSEYSNGSPMYQNKRLGSVFAKDVNGKNAYDIDGGPVFIDQHDCAYTCSESILRDIKFPYMPPKRREYIRRHSENVIQEMESFIRTIPTKNERLKTVRFTKSLNEAFAIESYEKIKGGATDNLSLSDIAKKHENAGYGEYDYLLTKLKQQLRVGIKVEMEHTTDPKIAAEIAMDHLYELPDYYDRLEDMESDYK